MGKESSANRLKLIELIKDMRGVNAVLRSFFGDKESDPAAKDDIIWHDVSPSDTMPAITSVKPSDTGYVVELDACGSCSQVTEVDGSSH